MPCELDRNSFSEQAWVARRKDLAIHLRALTDGIKEAELTEDAEAKSTLGEMRRELRVIMDRDYSDFKYQPNRFDGWNNRNGRN